MLLKRIDRYGGKSIFLYCCILLGSCIALPVFNAGTPDAYICKDEVIEFNIKLFRDAVGLYLIFMEDKANPHRTHNVDDFLSKEKIRRMY